MKQAGLLINGSDPENIKLILEDASIGDAFHDFNGSDVTISYDNIIPGLPGSIKTSGTFKKITEETVLKSAFKSDEAETITIPLKMADPEGGKAIDITPSVDTINGHKYKITRINVKYKDKDKRITADEFFQMGGFYTGDGPTQKNIALIIDCVSIKFMEMLKNGDKLAEIFKVFLLKAPEIENDPGGKTKISDKIFSESNGVYLKPAVPLDLNNGDVNKDKSYIYNYNDRDATSNNLYAGFYSKYTFELSELILKKKFIFENLSTTLTITDNSPDTINIGSKIVENSGSSNEITALVKFINSIKELFTKKQDDRKLTFNINASFQQKRSGDWFQALLAALVTNNKRDFSEYTKDGANNTKIPFESTDVYLVTHDRILLAFALLLGINVIFTHKKPKDDVNKLPSLHSAVIYRINNPEQIAEQNAKILASFKATHKIRGEEIVNDLRDLTDIKGIFTMQTMITAETSTINTNIERIKAMIAAKKINTAEINDCTQKIFASTFILNLLETQKPKEIQELIVGYTKLVLPLMDETDINKINTFNALYSELRNKKDIFVQKTSGITTLSFGESINKQLKKSQPYTFIKKWEWLGSTKFNIVEDDIIFTVTNTKSKKRNDKNIFLAELNRVSSAEIKKISDVYVRLYDFILANQVAENYVDKKNNSLDGRMSTKFKDKMTSFCIEVLINLNPLNDPAYNNQDKIKKYITDYKTLLISAGSTEAEVNRFEQKELISEYEEIKTMPMLDDSVINVESVVPMLGGQQQGGSLIKGGVYTFNYNDKENLKMLLAAFLFSKNLSGLGFEEALAVLESTSGESTSGGGPNPDTLRSNDSGIETASESRTTPVPTAATGALSSENTQQHVASPVQQQQPIFANNSYGFHPLLPIFLILESYYTQLLEVDDEIWDSDLYLKFYQILKSLINNLLKIYNDNKPGHKLQAIYLGYGLRELLFTSNQYSERSELEKNILELEEKDYNYFSLLSSMFSNGVCGNIVYDETDVQNGTKYIDNELFKNYLKTVDIKTIMEAPEAEIPIEDLRKLTKNLSMNISKKMLADISDAEASELFTLTSQKEAMSTPMPPTQISAPPEPVPEPEPVSLPEISVTNNMLLKNLSPALINKYKSRMTTRRLSNNLTRAVGGSKKRALKTYKKTHKKAQKNLKKNKGTNKKQKLRYKKYTKRRNTKNKK